MKISTKTIEKICEDFELGTFTGLEGTKITSFNEVYFIKTNKGKYVIKYLVPKKDKDISVFIERKEYSENVAYMASSSINTVVAKKIKNNENYLYSLEDGNYVLVYDFITYKKPSDEKLKPIHFAHMGRAIGQMESLKLPINKQRTTNVSADVEISRYVISLKTPWREILASYSPKDGEWYNILSKNIEKIESIYEEFKNIDLKKEGLSRRAVLHGDMHFENMLFDELENPIVLDWENASQWDVATSLLSTHAMNYVHLMKHPIEYQIKCIKAYFEGFLKSAPPLICDFELIIKKAFLIWMYPFIVEFRRYEKQKKAGESSPRVPNHHSIKAAIEIIDSMDMLLNVLGEVMGQGKVIPLKKPVLEKKPELNKRTFEKICSYFNLGTLIDTSLPKNSAINQNSVYIIQTSLSSFAVKILSINEEKKGLSKRLYSKLYAENIALLSSKEINTIPARQYEKGKFLKRLGKDTYALVYDYKENFRGENSPLVNPNPSHFRDIGNIFGKIQSLHLPEPKYQSSSVYYINAINFSKETRDYSSILQKHEDQKEEEWYKLLSSNKEKIENAEKEWGILEFENSPNVIYKVHHGDLHFSNLIFDEEGKATVIDWEIAGIHDIGIKFIETLSYNIYLVIDKGDELKKECIKAFVNGYLEEAAPLKYDMEILLKKTFFTHLYVFFKQFKQFEKNKLNNPKKKAKLARTDLRRAIHIIDNYTMLLETITETMNTIGEKI